MIKDILKKANVLSNKIDILTSKLGIVERKNVDAEKRVWGSELINEKFDLSESATDKIIAIAKEDLESQLVGFVEEFKKL